MGSIITTILRSPLVLKVGMENLLIYKLHRLELLQWLRAPPNERESLFSFARLQHNEPQQWGFMFCYSLCFDKLQFVFLDYGSFSL